jgi:hypothetical protein
MTLYPVKILSTGETMYFEHRSRTNQLWHEYLMSGYDDFDEWESDGYPPNTARRNTRQQEIQFWQDTWALLDELDEMIREILRAPVDWEQVRAEYEQQQARGTPT